MNIFRSWRSLQPHGTRTGLLAAVKDGTSKRSPLRQQKWSSTHASSPAIALRPYQEEAIQSVLGYLKRGERRLGLSLATGAGKTVIFSQLIGRIEPPNENATRTLILVHRRELVEQAAKHCRIANPDKSIEIEMGRHHASGSADITVGSVQTLIRGDRLTKYDPSTYKLVLVDEAHHIVANAYLTILSHFGLLKDKKSGNEEDSDLSIGSADQDGCRLDDEQQLTPCNSRSESAALSEQNSSLKANLSPSPTPTALVGVSATLSRFDGLSLGHAIDHVVYHKDYIDLINEQWLSDVIFSTVASNANLSKVRSDARGGDFRSSELSEAVNTNAINEITVQSWLNKAEGRKSTLVFCVDVAHAEDLTETFRGHGIDARMVSGQTSIVKRSALINAFRNQEYPVLTNVGVFTEGTDIPNIDCVLLARPTRSRNLLVQMIGRGMRMAPGKQNCHVIDMVAALRAGIVTVPTLFGLDPSVLLDKASAPEIQRQKVASPETLQYIDGQVPDRVLSKHDGLHSNVKFNDYSSIVDFIGDKRENTHVHRFSTNSWVNVGPSKDNLHDRYVLQGNDNSYLTIHDQGENSSPLPRYKVTLTETLSTRLSSHPNPGAYQRKPLTSYYATPRTIAKSETLQDAVHAADTWASKTPTFPRFLIDRYQSWKSRPMTAKQRSVIEKMLGGREEIDLSDYTMGQAGQILVKLKFGAKGRYNAASKQRITKAKAGKRAKELQERETVRVGRIA